MLPFLFSHLHLVFLISSPNFISTISLNGITDTVTSWIVDFGYPAVFAAALIENLFPAK